MAKVKSAKDKITAYLKGKGLDTNEIKDAFDELDAADIDLDTLAAKADLVPKWETFWKDTATPEFTKLNEERDKLKAKLDKLAAAGFRIDEGEPNPDNKDNKGNSGGVTQDYLKDFEQKLAGASSSVMKSLMKTAFKHYKKFGEEPDFDAIEKLLAEGKAHTVEDGYRIWSKPMREERRTKNLDKQVQQKIQEGVQAELSKKGITVARKRTDDIENAPLDKPAPSDKELKEAFLSDMASMPN